MGLQARIRQLVRRFGYELTPVKAVLPRDVRDDYDVILGALGEYSFKFLDVKTFLPLTIGRAHRLGLHKSRSLDVLDIGTGVGYFPFVCQHYGHRAVAIDRDGNQVFVDATKWLGVDRRTWEIHAHERLPDLGRRFDLITAFMVNFDRDIGRDLRPWGCDEWSFFLQDLTSHQLAEGGRVALLLNDHTMALNDVLQNLVDHGGRRDGSWVIFSSPPRSTPGSELD